MGGKTPYKLRLSYQLNIWPKSAAKLVNWYLMVVILCVKFSRKASTVIMFGCHANIENYGLYELQS